MVALVVLAVVTLEGDRAVAAATGALVLVTMWYAWQTRQLAFATAAARAEGVRPHLALDVEKLGAGHVLPRVVNVGAGPALSVNVRLRLEPAGLEIPYMAPAMAPGAGQSFLPKDSEGNLETELKRMVEAREYETVHLAGTCTDALGRVHEVADVLDLQAYSEAFNSGLWRSPPDELKRIADEVKRIADAR